MRSKAMATGFLLLLISPLVALVAGPPWAEGRASAAWRALGLPLEEFAARHPASAMNDSAQDLVRLGRLMGLPFGPDLPPPPAPAQEAFAAVRKDLRRHVQALLAGRPSRASEALRGFRENHAAEPSAVLRLLTDAPPPAWELDIARGLTAPVPPIGAHRDLADLVTLAALDPQAGDPAPETALRALVRLGAGLRGRPELVSLLMSAFVDRRALALARRLETASPALLDDLSRDRKPALFVALQAEAFQLRSFVARKGYRDADSQEWPTPVSPMSAPFMRAYFRLSAADYSRVVAGVADRFARALSCRPPAVAPEQDLASLGRWNTPGRRALFDFRAVGRVLLLYALDVELTGKVLALRAQRAANGAWPAQWAEPGSQVCPGTSWSYERGADGGMALAYAGPLEPGEADELRFTAPP